MSTWQERAAAKRDSIIALIPAKWRLPTIPSAEEQRDVTGTYLHQFLTPREIEITETDAVGICAQTTTGQWTATEVTEAFCHRAALAHQLVNCLHEIFFDAALEDAARLDRYYSENGKPVGPLHGLPVSLKDQFHVKGVETSMGYVGWLGTFEGLKGTGKERVYESLMTRQLRDLGAVLYVKTAVPHTLMCGETVNNIIGYCWNPKNRNLTAGGSSGGEGALIACRGSPVGFGTDIGGSIRIPSAYNGLYSLRPSHGRLPYEGLANSMQGQNSILSVVGPLATSLASLKLVTQALLTQQPWLSDPLVNDLPWRDSKEDEIYAVLRSAHGNGNGNGSGGLAFGILHDDGIVRPTPPVRRALALTVSALRRLGHTVVPWHPPSHATGLALANETWTFDGGADVHGAFGLSGETPAAQIGAHFGPAPVAEYTASRVAAVNVRKRDYQRAYLEYWNGTAAVTGTGRPVDAVIAPVAPYPAARPGGSTSYAYTTIFNVLDYTAATFPVTTADKDVDVADATFASLSGAPADEETWKLYDPAVYDGAPVALQVVGRRLQEEGVLALAGVIDEALKNNE